MAIVAGFDVHRRQITFDALDTETGEVIVVGSTRRPRRWRAGRSASMAARCTSRWRPVTGWLFVCDALVAAGAVPHLAEPVETRALRGRKRRAKTDREDARWLRVLLVDGRLPEAWIPPEHVRQWRSRARLRHTLIDERTQWMQRIQATLFHHGVGGTPEKLRTRAGRAFLDGLELPDDARERIEVALAMIDAIDAQIAPLERELRQLARRQTGCRALMRLYGMGELTSLVTLCELGDVGACRPHARPSGWPASTSACTAPTAAQPRRQAQPPGLTAPALGALSRPRWPPAGRAAPTTPTTSRSRPAASATRARR